MESEAGQLTSPAQRAKILSLMPTRQCTAACNNCGTFSNPHAKTRLTESVVTDAIRQSKALGFEVVVFTGGEATLVGLALFDYIRLAHELGLVTRLVTNGHWGISDAKTTSFISRLVDVGLNEINFSTGDEHVRFVPLERVVRGAVKAAQVGLTTAIMVELTRHRKITRASIETHPFFTEMTRSQVSPAIMISESPWMSMKPDEQVEYPPGVAVDKSNIHVRRGCDSVLSTLTIEADGSAYACCGLGMTLIPELRLGHVHAETLETLSQRAGDDFLKHWIGVEGPERILAWAASIDPSIQWEGMYAHRCQACLRLYTDAAVREVIRKRFEEVVPDVVFLEWLLHHMVPPVAAAASDSVLP
jgi:hypothetical protein